MPKTSLLWSHKHGLKSKTPGFGRGLGSCWWSEAQVCLDSKEKNLSTLYTEAWDTGWNLAYEQACFVSRTCLKKIPEEESLPISVYTAPQTRVKVQHIDKTSFTMIGKARSQEKQLLTHCEEFWLFP